MQSQRILIVDDEQHILTTLAQLLESAGHTVVGKALDGEEAVRLNEALNPDVILLDLQMPGMDGLEAASRIMAEKPTPIVICSAYYDDELVKKASDAGAYAYVVKPCRLADLLPALNVAVSRFKESKTLKNEVDKLKEALEHRCQQ